VQSEVNLSHLNYILTCNDDALLPGTPRAAAHDPPAAADNRASAALARGIVADIAGISGLANPELALAETLWGPIDWSWTPNSFRASRRLCGDHGSIEKSSSRDRRPRTPLNEPAHIPKCGFRLGGRGHPHPGHETRSTHCDRFYRHSLKIVSASATSICSTYRRW
jgi:hypothetical protein